MMEFMMLFTFIVIMIWYLKNGCERSSEENICECDSCQAGEFVCSGLIHAFASPAEGLKLARYVKAV